MPKLSPEPGSSARASPGASAFVNNGGRLDLQARDVPLNGDGVNRNGRALVEAVQFTCVSACVRFRQGHHHTKLLSPGFKRTVPRTGKVFRRCLTKDVKREAKDKQQHQQSIFHIP